MARKKKRKISPSAIKITVISLLALLGIFLLTKVVVHLLVNADYFKINIVTYDDSLQFINKRDLNRLKGKSIFTIDLKDVQKRLYYKYPQIADLSVVKEFPNRISIKAKKRMPFVQMNIKAKTVTMDNDGVVLSMLSKQNDELPLILGSRARNRRVELGDTIRHTDVKVALSIVDAFKNNPSLLDYKILTVNVGNLSKIYIELSNKLQVIVDKDLIEKRMMVLGVVLAQKQLDLNEIKYFDLRYKDPLIGKK